MKKFIVYVFSGILLNNIVLGGTHEAYLEQIKARLGFCQNIIIEYETAENFTPPEKLLTLQNSTNGDKSKKQFNIVSGKYERRKKCAFLNGNAHYYDTLLRYPSSDPEELKMNRYVYEEFTSKEGKVERLLKGNKESRFRGTIGGMSPPEYDIEYALGIKGKDHNEWISDTNLSDCEISIDSERYVILSKVDEKEVKHEWKYDMQYGFALTAYRTYILPENYINVDIAVDSFGDFNGLFLPTKITSRLLYWEEGTYKTAKESILYDIKYKIDDPSNTADSYSIKWPDNTIFIDRNTGIPLFIKDNMVILKDSIHEDALKQDIESLAVNSFMTRDKNIIFLFKSEYAIPREIPYVLDLTKNVLRFIDVDFENCKKEESRDFLGNEIILRNGRLLVFRGCKLYRDKETRFALEYEDMGSYEEYNILDSFQVPFIFYMVTYDRNLYSIKITEVHEKGLKVIYELIR